MGQRDPCLRIAEGCIEILRGSDVARYCDTRCRPQALQQMSRPKPDGITERTRHPDGGCRRTGESELIEALEPKLAMRDFCVDVKMRFNSVIESDEFEGRWG